MFVVTLQALLLHLTLWAHGSHAFLTTPTYVAPVDLSSDDSLVRAGWDRLSRVFDSHLLQHRPCASLARTENVTFSASMFSLHDTNATDLQYHYTAPQIANAVNGSRHVDGNSIYRVASVSKLITALTAQIHMTAEELQRPITYYLPELKNATSTESTAPVWENITPWTLASQLSGIGALGPLGDLMVAWTLDATAQNTTLPDYAVEKGLPPIDPSPQFLPCVSGNCTQAEFLASVEFSPPVLAPDTTPEYSDIGFMLLGSVLTRVTGKPYDELYRDAVFDVLDMPSSSANAPLEGEAFNRSVVVAGTFTQNWDFPANLFTIPSGGIVSTINDLNKLGTAILNSTLLAPNRTKSWMKPISHTASLTYSVGAPWEIVRYINNETSKVTDLYTKLGDSGSYGSMLVVIPEYDAGFTFLNAFYEDPAEAAAHPQLYDVGVRSDAALKLINQIVEIVLPALEAQAAKESCHNIAGTFAVSDNINSSLTLVCEHGQPGLLVKEWISNSTDMIKEGLLGSTASQPARLLVSIPSQGFAGAAAGGQVTLQASVNPQTLTYDAAGRGPMTGIYKGNFDWLSGFEGPRYGGGGLRTFTFDIDANGAATAVTNGAARLRMPRV